MKNKYQERLRQRAKDYHRSQSLGVDATGLYTHHLFEPVRHLSWWHDIRFILNNQRVTIWWVHPRMRYSDLIDEATWQVAGEFPKGEDPITEDDPQYKRVGRSRKKVSSYLLRPNSTAANAFYAHVEKLREQFTVTGIDRIVRPSMEVGHYQWGTGVDLCVPMEIRTHADAVALVALARRLLKRETTCALEFGDYRYGKADWLGEAEARAIDQARRREEFVDS